MNQNEQNKYLIKTLQGILMILPQSQTFTVLKTRLDCVNITNFSMPFINTEEEIVSDKEANKKFIVDCLQQYDTKQTKLRLYQSQL